MTCSLSFKATVDPLLAYFIAGFDRFISGVTPADLLVARMAVEPFPIHVLAHVQALLRPDSGIQRVY